MIELPLNQEILNAAKDKAIAQGSNRTSFMRGKGNYVGYVGEYAVKRALGIPFEPSTRDYDFILNEKRYDVKSKKTTVIPKMSYDASICKFSKAQDCDFYIFCRVYFPVKDAGPEKVFVMSYYPKTDYMAEAKFLQKGEYDPSNRYSVMEDCYNLRYDQLKSAKDIFGEVCCLS